MNSRPLRTNAFNLTCSLTRFACLLSLLAGLTAGLLRAEEADSVPTLEIQADQVAARVSPMLYGLMTEEINFSYDGGLYAELVRNRTFQEHPTIPRHWRLIQENGSTNSMTIDTNEPLNEVLIPCLKLDITQASENRRVGLANDGFWGIPVQPETRYRASFYAKASKGFTGPLTVAIVDNSNATVYARAEVPELTRKWKRYEVTLTTGRISATKENHLEISTGKPGTIWLNLVSLFPPTWNDRTNGNRKDIMQLLADMKPAFLRFPGGNYLEGNFINTRFDWKKTIGDISQRPGHTNDAWRYWSSDGMGLLEFLHWCEDLHMEPVLGVYAGYSLRGQRVAPGKDLQPYVQDALDEIEYITGDRKTKWGARRAKDGHPAPFKLEYVEIGNEDNFDRANGGTYQGRFAQFHDAIRAKYPSIKLISTMPSGNSVVTNRTPDVIDDHFYRNSMQMQADTAHYDNYDRNGPKIFVGEWATREGRPTPNMNAALGDAAWMTGMERNSDLVIMASYAPLFVNISPGAMQWPTDLIGYDGLTSYGSPSYYAQQMFNVNRGDVVLPVKSAGIPSREWQPPVGRRGGGPPPPRQVPSLFFVATRDRQSGTIFLKLVNTVGTPQPVRVSVKGVKSVAPDSEAIVLSAENPTDTNSITEPTKIVPVTSKTDGLSSEFTRTLPPYSITVLKLRGS